SLHISVACHCYKSSTAIYTPSLHDALPISKEGRRRRGADEHRSVSGRKCGSAAGSGAGSSAGGRQESGEERVPFLASGAAAAVLDRKSTRLNSSHVKISYAVFCLKKKNNT